MMSVIGPVQSRYTGAVCVIIIVAGAARAAGAAFSNTQLPQTVRTLQNTRKKCELEKK